MCGICGWISSEGQLDERVFDNMVDLQKHRGPDDRGTYVNGRYGIGMRRLSIIDVTTGHQPIHNEDGSLWIVFNGEIYNYLELRSDLENKGHKFYTNTDTETILHLFEEYGEKTPQKLQGMFTFAILDNNSNQIFVARDRFGIKPLYYYWDGKDFLFASEIKSILANPVYRKELDLESVEIYFTFGYLADTQTMFSGIKKLLPAHSLILNDTSIEIKKYWDFPEPSDSYKTETEYFEIFLEKFSKSVERHLVSDVALGAFLSGGIDSSLVVAMMSKIKGEPIETFSIGYGETGKSFDERSYAKLVAKQFKTNHHEFVLEPNILNMLPEIVSCLDQPIGDASVIPNYYLSKKVREFVKVALSGLGGDELCAGYERYLGTILANYYNKMPKSLKEWLILPAIKRLPDSKKGFHFPERAKRFVRFASLPLGDRYYNIIAKFNEEEKQYLFGKKMWNDSYSEVGSTIYQSYWKRSENEQELKRLLRIDMEMYIVNDLLLLTDNVSMAHSLEIRVPYLDHDLVEFFWSLPSDLKIKGMKKKYLLKKVAERILPRKIIHRPKKGFSVPLTIWFRNELKPYVEKMLGRESVESLGFFNYKYIRRLLDEHYCGYVNHDEKIFLLLVYMIWHEKYFAS